MNFGGLGTGAVPALRRAALDDWPDFDERLGRGVPQDCSDELYAYFTLVERGYRVVCTPEAVVQHPTPESMADLRRRLLVAASGATNSLCQLFVEHQKYRQRAVDYARETMGGRKRDW